MSLPEPVQFYLDTCNRIALRGTREGVEALTPIERTVFRAYTFDSDEQNGSLSQFFYNTDSSPDTAEATAAALEVIGALKTAGVLRVAASVVCRSDARGFTGTWSGYLAHVDPAGRLDECIAELSSTGESISDSLQHFILQHRNELQEGGGTD